MDELSKELIHRVSLALTAGQEVFTKEQLEEAVQEIEQFLIHGQIAQLVIEKKLKMHFDNGTIKYEAIPGAAPPVDPLSFFIDQSQN